jgi:hypothetical protein
MTTTVFLKCRPFTKILRLRIFSLLTWLSFGKIVIASFLRKGDKIEGKVMMVNGLVRRNMGRRAKGRHRMQDGGRAYCCSKNVFWNHSYTQAEGMHSGTRHRAYKRLANRDVEMIE